MTDLAHSDWNGWRIARWTVAAILLLIPALAMQVSDEWNWGVGDFLFAGVMIVGTALLYEWAASLSGGWTYKAGAAIALGAAFAAGLRPAGMARAMLATAGFQLLVTALAAYDGWGASEPPGAAGIFALSVAFAALWLASAALFWKAAREPG